MNALQVFFKFTLIGFAVVMAIFFGWLIFLIPFMF
jgi:hypothetical protein